MRLYCFPHFMISTMAKGIQSLHSAVELFNKYTPNQSNNDCVDSDMYDLLFDWSLNHKTCIVLNGGVSPDLDSIKLFFERDENIYPWTSFNEDESLGNLMTSISIVLPEKIYETSSAMRTGVLSFNDDGLLVCVNTFVLDPEMIAKLMSFGVFNKWEQEMVVMLNKFKLAQ